MLGLTGGLALAAPPARAQNYPNHVVKIVVPYPAGGTADVMPRILADWLSRKWGQSVIIENRTGAGGNIGAEVVAKSDPDGYTLLETASVQVVNPFLYKSVPFDVVKDFTPITLI
ncbi:MAG: tripartite tricarboxylate transporter substrate-binding protein, partial [Candidatus Sulfotelmatobacter sp.]